MKYNPYPPKRLPEPKYKVGTYFRNLDTENIFKLIEIRQDTYIIQSINIKDPIILGESELTIEYDYELLKEGEILIYGKK